MPGGVRDACQKDGPRLWPVDVSDLYIGLRGFARPTGCCDTTRSSAECDRSTDDDDQARPWDDIWRYVVIGLDADTRHEIWLHPDIDIDHAEERLSTVEPDRREDHVETAA